MVTDLMGFLILSHYYLIVHSDELSTDKRLCRAVCGQELEAELSSSTGFFLYFAVPLMLHC